jgi:hypothetical protein
LFERPMFINDNPTAHSSHCYIIQAARGDWHISLTSHVLW